jgi:hypothetical protein
MARKKVLGADPLSWIKPTIPVDEKLQIETRQSLLQEEEKTTLRTSEVSQSRILYKGENLNVPKFQTYEIKLTLRLKENQLEFLSRLERKIMKNRSCTNRKERITKNSIIRAMIDVFRNLSIDTNEISDENELKIRFKKIMDRSL